MPKLVMLSGPSASGKSTVARELMTHDPNMVRVNRDQLREMSILKWTPAREDWIRDAEVAMVRAASSTNKNVVVDDTNLMPRDTDRWKGIARDMEYEFEKKVIKTPFQTCVIRDMYRTGSASLGRPTIERQFLRAGLIEWPEDKQVVIFDIDGTLADLTHRVNWIRPGASCPECKGRGHFETSIFVPQAGMYKSACLECEGTGVIKKKNYEEFYGRVHMDNPIDIVVRWAQECAKHYFLVIVSGRSPEKCGEETVSWLERHKIPFKHIFMRRSNVHGPDTVEKQLILNDILKMIPKEKIAFVVDDRPSVVAMWRQNNIRVIPVRGRDDDEFYSTMDEFEATHPPGSAEKPATSSVARDAVVKDTTRTKVTGSAPSAFLKKRYKRPLSSYFTQAIVRTRRFLAHLT